MFCKNGVRMMQNLQRTSVLRCMARNQVALRGIGTSSVLRDSFKVQDMDDFKDKVLNSEVPVVVDFFATWCGPCRLLTPRIESVIAEENGKVNLAKVDIDELTDLAFEYDVTSVPVLISMKGGKEQERMVGLQDADKLRSFVSRLAPKK
ncbi:thioredoxin, mitochondrial [Neocloeon triangulifer]|uniref:thioredoxin, mitochondrial n=1 Tax=Neocloeon triangulifer TaxID=2078957 RepID=UPI00286F1C76|nr:thioredoxin, mitochondrial [Neocloeon triangulifer]